MEYEKNVVGHIVRNAFGICGIDVRGVYISDYQHGKEK